MTNSNGNSTLPPEQIAPQQALAEEIGESLQDLAGKSQVRTRYRWLAYAATLIVGVALTALLGDWPNGYGHYFSVGAPGFLLILYVVHLARDEARDFGSFVEELSSKEDNQSEERWSIANKSLIWAELSRAQAVTSGAFMLLLVAYAAEKILLGEGELFVFGGYFLGGCFALGLAVGLLSGVLNGAGAPEQFIAFVVGSSIIVGAISLLYLAQVWAIGSDVTFFGFLGRGLTAFALLLAAGVSVGFVGGVFSGLLTLVIFWLGDRQIVSLPKWGERQIKLLLYKVTGQSTLFWGAAVAFAPVLALASSHIYPPVVFGFGFLTFAGLFFGVIIWSAVDVKAEQFGVFILLIKGMLLSLAISFTLASLVGYVAATLVRLSFEAMFGELGSMIFPDAVFSTFSLSPYDFPIVDAAIGIGLATILLYILSYLIAIVVRGDRLRLLFLTTLTLAFFVGPRLMEFFNLAAPTKIVEPVASVMGVNTATVNQLLLLLPLYFVLLCLQFTFTKRYRCDDRDCRAPAMYEHAKYCWKCQKERAVEDASPAPSLPRAKSLPGPTIG